MTKPRKIYTREYKISLIQLIDSGTPLAQVARENGIHPNLITKWKKQYAKDPNRAFSGNGNSYTDQARIAELERLLGKTYAENEFLKKVLAKLGKRIQDQDGDSVYRRDIQ